MHQYLWNGYQKTGENYSVRREQFPVIVFVVCKVWFSDLLISFIFIILITPTRTKTHNSCSWEPDWKW